MERSDFELTVVSEFPDEKSAIKEREFSVELFDLNRKPFTQIDLEQEYEWVKLENNNLIKSFANYCFKYYKLNRKCLGSQVMTRLPIFNTISSYDYKASLLLDLIVGLTIGMIIIPQSK
jgi:hypothetical protein